MRMTYLWLTALLSTPLAWTHPVINTLGHMFAGATLGATMYTTNTGLHAACKQYHAKLCHQETPLGTVIQNYARDHAPTQVHQATQYIVDTGNKHNVQAQDLIFGGNLIGGALLNHMFTRKAPRSFAIPFYLGQAAVYKAVDTYYQAVDAHLHQYDYDNVQKNISSEETDADQQYENTAQNTTTNLSPTEIEPESSWSSLLQETYQTAQYSGLLGLLLRK